MHAIARSHRQLTAFGLFPRKDKIGELIASGSQAPTLQGQPDGWQLR